MSDRTVLITGAGRGIGRATALRFAQAGDRIAIMSRTRSELDETVRLAHVASERVLIVSGDVASERDVQRAVAAVIDRFGYIDILVNAAAVAPFGPAGDMAVAEFDKMMGVNIRGVFLTCRAVWPHFTARRGGTVVNVSSVAARDPFPGLVPYGGSKAFVETFTRGLANEGRAAGIRAFGVAPGAVKTKMLLDLFPDFPEQQMLQPDDVASLIEWLCDPRCAHCSGQTITINKGG